MRSVVATALCLSAVAVLAAATVGCPAAIADLVTCDAPFSATESDPDQECCGATAAAITACGGLTGVLSSWGTFTDNFNPTSLATSHRIQEYIGFCPAPDMTEGQCVAHLQTITECTGTALAQSQYADQQAGVPLPSAFLQQVATQCCPSLVNAGTGMTADLACMAFRPAMEQFFQPAGPTASLFSSAPMPQFYLGFQNMSAPNSVWATEPAVLELASATPAQLLAAAQAAWPGPAPFPNISFFCGSEGSPCPMWKVQLPSNYFFENSLSLVTGAASVEGNTVPPPDHGASVLLDMGSGGMSHTVALAFFLLTHQYNSDSATATHLPSECRRFPEAMCDAAVGRVLDCLVAHESPTSPRLPSDPYCEGSIAKLVPDVCAGFPWRAKARAAQTTQELADILVERFMRAVEVSQQGGGDYGAPCNATIPSLKYTSDRMLLTSHCAASAEEGYVCLNSTTPHLVSPSTGIAYYAVNTTVHSPSLYTSMSSDGCHSDVYNAANQQGNNRP